MSKLSEWITSGGLIQGVIALLLVGGWVYMALSQIPVNETYIGATMLVLGFYFGSKFQTYLVNYLTRSGRSG